MPSVTPIELGNPLPLSCTLINGASGLFPRVHVYDSAGAEVGASPIDLSEVGSTGRYTSLGFTPITKELFTAHFIVYTNAGHTVESVLHGRHEEMFIVTQFPADITEIQSKLPTNEIMGSSDKSDKDDEIDNINSIVTTNLDVAVSSIITALGTLNDISIADVQTALTNQGYTPVRAAMIELIKKMLINRLELADGDTNNWVLYDDDDSTPLLEFSVTDKLGSGIVQPNLFPSRRTRGLTP
jgi:hypothetical protein